MEPDDSASYFDAVFDRQYLPMEIETRGGEVSAVSFSVDSKEYATYPTIQVAYTVSALLGTRELFPSGQSDQVITGAAHTFEEGTRTWEVDGWTVTVTLDATGYYRYLDSYFIDPDSDVARPRFFFAFRMERT